MTRMIVGRWLMARRYTQTCTPPVTLLRDRESRSSALAAKFRSSGNGWSGNSDRSPQLMSDGVLNRALDPIAEAQRLGPGIAVFVGVAFGFRWLTRLPVVVVPPTTVIR